MTERLEAFTRGCRAAGFDLVHPFAVAAYNRSAEAAHRLPDLGRAAPLGLVVGNTRWLWDVFRDALATEPSRLDERHPLDAYARDRITTAATTLGAGHRILWADDVESNAVPVQRIAHATGLAWLSPSHLSVHPAYGPWFAFRAVIVVDEECAAHEPHPAADPCTRCPKPCVAALEEAVRVSRTLDQDALTEHFDVWRRVRDVCPEGVEHRYGEEQVRYHYTKERVSFAGRHLRGAPAR